MRRTARTEAGFDEALQDSGGFTTGAATAAVFGAIELSALRAGSAAFANFQCLFFLSLKSFLKDFLGMFKIKSLGFLSKYKIILEL